MRRVLCTRRNKEVAGGSAFTRPCGAWPCGVSALWPQRRVRAVPCLHLSRAGRDARVRFAAAVTRSLLPVCRDFPVVRPLRFRGLTLQLPSAVCVRLRLPLRPCIPALSPGFYGGTAPPGGKRLVRTVLIFTESSDQLSRATDRVPGLPASPGYVQ